jgi:phage shock protein PspC (stress-responsive transcriptional regulator)
LNVQIDYVAVAMIAGASGFFGAFGSELACYLISVLKERHKRIVARLNGG